MREQILMNYGDFEYTINENDEVCLERYRGDVENLIIPSEIDGKKVTSIGNSAFEDCESLISIEIPDSVTSIGYGIFSGCENLCDVNISDKNENFEVIDNILYNKREKSLISCFSNNSHITIPSGIQKIENNAFSWCRKIEKLEISNTVTSIGVGAFSHCSSLTSVDIPNSVTRINIGTFFACRKLMSINISNSVIHIEPVAFASCKSLISIEIPDSVTSIGNSAFAYCKSLTSIVLPDSLVSIGEKAFDDCPSLTIQCNAGSYAEQYCKENNLKYFITPDWLLD